MRHLARNGSRGTTLAQIAEECGVSQSALIYHFPTKEALLHAVLDARDEEEDYFGPEDAGEGLTDLLRHIVEQVARWQSHPDVVGMHTVLVAENVGGDGVLHGRLLERYVGGVERLAKRLVACQRRGEIRPDVDMELKAVELIAFINGLETAWLLRPDLPAAAVATEWAAHQLAALTPPQAAARSTPST